MGSHRWYPWRDLCTRIVLDHVQSFPCRWKPCLLGRIAEIVSSDFLLRYRNLVDGKPRYVCVCVTGGSRTMLTYHLRECTRIAMRWALSAGHRPNTSGRGPGARRVHRCNGWDGNDEIIGHPSRSCFDYSVQKLCFNVRAPHDILGALHRVKLSQGEQRSASGGGVPCPVGPPVDLFQVAMVPCYSGCFAALVPARIPG